MKFIGKCFYCKESVMASEGQAIRWKVVRGKYGTEESPTHKKCRRVGNK